MLNLITVVIPVREIGIMGVKTTEEWQERVRQQKEQKARLDKTVQTIMNQTMGITVVNIIRDNFQGANYARNRGFDMVRTPFVLFSDDDIDWEPDAFENLYHALYTNPQASYSYGWYEMNGKRYCDQPFNADLLRQKNYISTMSLIRKEDFLYFDPEIKRLQDWELWLTLLDNGKTGVYCEEKIFSTCVREGITFGKNGDTNPNAWREAERIVKRNHGLQ